MTNILAVKSIKSDCRLEGWASIASGLSGGLALGCLVWYIATPANQMQDSGAVAPLGRLLLETNFVAAMLQALLMVPVAVRLARLVYQAPALAHRATLLLGVAALLAVAILRFIALVHPASSDILFMAPMGFVGLWLIIANWLLKPCLARGTRLTGTLAGIGLFIMGLNFFWNGGLIEFTHPYAYGMNRSFHIGLALSFPGLVLFPIWSVLLGSKVKGLECS